MKLSGRDHQTICVKSVQRIMQ